MNPVFLHEVDARNSILEEIELCKHCGSRSLKVEIGEVAIRHIAKEIYSHLESPLKLEDFIAAFRKDVITGDEKVRHQYQYFETSQPGHVGVKLMPNDKSVFFDIITDESGERILKYRYWKYQ